MTLEPPGARNHGSGIVVYANKSSHKQCNEGGCSSQTDCRVVLDDWHLMLTVPSQSGKREHSVIFREAVGTGCGSFLGCLFACFSRKIASPGAVRSTQSAQATKFRGDLRHRRHLRQTAPHQPEEEGDSFVLRSFFSPFWDRRDQMRILRRGELFLCAFPALQPQQVCPLGHLLGVPSRLCKTTFLLA